MAQVSDPPVGGGMTGEDITAAAFAGCAVAADAVAVRPRPLIAATPAARPAARRSVLRIFMTNPLSP
jgi:hypothetical protein